MRILPIINNSSFKSNSRVVLKNGNKMQPSENDGLCDDSEILYSNYTTFFRQDLDFAYPDEYGFMFGWNGFAKTIEKHFENVPKVHVYDFACSDGSEAYSFAMTMIDKMGAKAEKFFPVKAYDIDDEMINVAKSGKILFDTDDFESMKFTIKKPYKNYFNLAASFDEKYKFLFVANPSLQEKIQFQKGDINNLIDTIEPSNSLIFIRNVWQYLDNQKEVFEKLADRLNSNSLVVIGMYDNDSIWQDCANDKFDKICPFVYRKK